MEGEYLILRSTAADSTGFTSGAVRRSLVVLRPPVRMGLIPAVALHVSLSQDWSAYPVACEITDRYRCYLVRIGDADWVEALLRISEGFVEPFLKLLAPDLDCVKADMQSMNASGTGASASAVDRTLFERKIHSLIRGYADINKAPALTFPSHKMALTWYGAMMSQNEGWKSASIEERGHLFERYIRANAPTDRSSDCLGELFGNRTARIGFGSIPAKQWTKPRVKEWLTQGASLGESVPGSVIVEIARTLGDSSPGGPRKLSFAYQGAPMFEFGDSKPKEDQLEKSGLWWWNDPENRFGSSAWQLFEDNWERSAYFYEFRARVTGRIVYEPFKVPWAWLGAKERAALYYLWPMRLDRVYSFVLKKSPMATVDLREPLEQILTHIRGEHLVFHRRDSLSLLAGEPEKGERYDWNLIEAIDREIFLNQTLGDNYRRVKSRHLERYKKLCQDCGIDPLVD